jgi:hypothetical protein
MAMTVTQYPAVIEKALPRAYTPAQLPETNIAVLNK